MGLKAAKNQKGQEKERPLLKQQNKYPKEVTTIILITYNTQQKC